jgi:hypothetical protein
MGITRTVLSWRRLARQCIFYSDSLRIDLAENFHLHFRNIRLTFSPGEFARVTRAFVRSYFEWRLLGRPAHVSPDQYVPFVTALLPLLEGEDFERARAAELAVELQQQTDYIHLHYRNLRLELTIDEFTEFALTIEASRRELDVSGAGDAPRRLGIRHGTNPRGRVNSAPNSGRFWTSTQPVETYRSLIRAGDGWADQFTFQQSPTLPAWRRRLRAFFTKWCR